MTTNKTLVTLHDDYLNDINDDWQTMRPHVYAIAETITARYPAVERNGYPCVPSAHVEAISEHLTMIVAEVIQAYIDAGSERDVTLEELGPQISDHLNGWTEKDHS